MIPVLTAADVRRQDAAATGRGIMVETLMRAAGTAVAQAAIEMLGGAYGRRVVAVCGKGNNGGDGLVAARLLRARGAAVTVCLPAGEPQPDGPAGSALLSFGGPIVPRGSLQEALARADLVIDALLGVGLSRAPEGTVAAAIAVLNASGRPVLAVDVPSGLDGDTGVAPGDAVRAWHTLALGGLKPGLLFAAGRAFAGTVAWADIGMPEDLRSGAAGALEGTDVAALVPRREPGANKYRSGVALCVCGSRAMPGAAALVAEASVRSGAGLTILAAPAAACAIAVTRTPEIVTVPLPDAGDGVLDTKGLDAIRERLSRAGSLAIGPGLTTHPAAAEAVRALAAEAGVPLVLDADGLNAFAGAPAALADRRAPTVLTPHAGEFARLTGAPPGPDRLRAAANLAAATGCVVLLKGAGTVVADPAGRLVVNVTGGPSLASAGTGDVLTGIIGALLARGLDAFDAAAAAAWMHGAAGDLAAAGGAPAPASGVAAALPRVFEELAR